MIKISSKETTNFNNNGYGMLRDCVSCNVREELNGEYELTLEYPLFGENKDYLIEDNIIVAPTPNGNQAFRIYATETNLNTIYVNARHIFYDLINNFLEDVRPTNQNGAGALNWILSNTQFDNNFTSTSDITLNNSANYVRKNVVEGLLSDDENSFINRWGGQLLRDNWNIAINNSIGADRGVRILYGKNLLGLQASIDISSVVTRVMPTGLNEDDTVLLLPEKYIDSPNINLYSSPRIAHYHFSDIKISSEEGEEVTEAEALEMLREQASLLFSEQKIDEPILNINVDFIELSKTEEYKNYSILETIFPFDIVTVEYQGIGFSQKAKMISYEYDCLLNKYTSIELGQFISNYADAQAKVNQELIKISEEILANKDILQKSIDNATDILTNALGGYVLKRDGELLIMDTEDPNTTTKVWRWNLNGLGYSSTGINGPYTTAITMDGGIVATFITTGTLNANLIKTGILQDVKGKNYIDMDNGTFNFGDGAMTYDTDNGLKVKGNVEADSGKIGGWEIGSLGSYSQSLYSTYCAADTPSADNPEYAVFMRSYGGPSNIAIGIKKRESSSTAWTDAENPFYVRKDGYVYLKNAFTIGSISGGTVAEHKPDYSKWTHEDGSYTRIGTDGLKRYVAGSGNKYHSLFYVKWLTFNVTSASDEKTFTLPEEFQDTDPYLFAVVENVTVPYGHTLHQFGASAGLNDASTGEVFVNAWVSGYEGTTLTYEGSVGVYVVAIA